jgi:hypothetical protein
MLKRFREPARFQAPTMPAHIRGDTIAGTAGEADWGLGMSVEPFPHNWIRADVLRRRPRKRRRAN